MQPIATKTASRSRSTGRRYASVPSAAEYAGCEHKLIRKLVASGDLKAYRLGSRLIRIDLDELDALMAGGAA